MKIRIHWKLTALFFCMSVITIAVIYAYLQSHLKEYVVRQFENNLRREVQVNRDLLQAAIGTKLTQEQAELLADTIGRDLQIRTTIIATDGTVMGDSDRDGEQLGSMENHLERPEVQGALKTGFGRSERYSRTLKKQMLYMALPMAVSGEHRQWIVRAAVPLSDMASLEGKVRRIVLVSVFIALTSSIVLSALASFLLSRPLVEMAAVARRFAAGDFTKKIYVSSRDEIGDLADALNHTAEELRHSVRKMTGEEAKLQAVLSSMGDGVMVTDGKGKIVMMNPALRRMFLVDAPPEGKSPIEVIRSAAVQDIVRRVLQDGPAASAREDVRIGGDLERYLLVNGAPVEQEGKSAGAVLVFHDISELKRLERVRKDFVANVSHELRTPIASIRGYAETLLHGAIDDAAHAGEFVAVIHDESERLAKLIEDLLDLSSIESGSFTMQRSPVALRDIVDRVLSIVGNQARQKEIILRNEVSKALPPVSADETRLTQVFLNLVDNAVKFTPAKGAVTIRAGAVEGRMALIEIADTGVGIPEKDLSRIFERFYRVDKAHSRELGGTGLGLSIVRHIVRCHGGDVSVSSEEMKGTTFSFTIPLA